MKRRVFLGIPVPEEVKRLIAAWQSTHAEIPVRWIKPENLHITLVPPWYMMEDELYESAKMIERTVSDVTPFVIVFEKVLFGPSGQPPRLIWAEGDTLDEFKNLKISIEKTLLQNFKTGFLKQESRPAKLHLTLARFRPGSIPNFTELNEKVDWKFEAVEIAFMESELKRGGAEYTILQKFKFR